MFKKYFVHTPFVITNFPLHKKIKKDLLNKLDKSKGSSFKNKKGHMNYGINNIKNIKRMVGINMLETIQVYII